MSDLILISNKPATTASPYGLGYWGAVDGCFRRNWLDKVKPAPLHGDYGDRINEARCGQLFHELRRWYNDPNVDDGDLVYDFDAAEVDIDFAEALRLFNEWRKHFPRFEFAETMALETMFVLVQKGHTWPDMEKDMDAWRMDKSVFLVVDDGVLARYGVPIYSGRWDGGGLHTEKTLDAYEKRRINKDEFGVTEQPDYGLPGVKLTDTKTMTTHRAVTELKWHESLQMWLYMQAWNDTHDKYEACKGMLVECVARHNDSRWAKKQEENGEIPTGLRRKSFWTIFVPPPSERQLQIARTNMAEWRAQRERIMKKEVSDISLNQCFSWHYACPHLEDGSCDRIPHNRRD